MGLYQGGAFYGSSSRYPVLSIMMVGFVRKKSSAPQVPRALCSPHFIHFTPLSSRCDMICPRQAQNARHGGRSRIYTKAQG